MLHLCTQPHSKDIHPVFPKMRDSQDCDQMYKVVHTGTDQNMEYDTLAWNQLVNALYIVVCTIWTADNALYIVVCTADVLVCTWY